MSKKAQVSRCLLIIKELSKKAHQPFEALQFAVNKELDLLSATDQEYSSNFTLDQFNLDLIAIKDLFGVEILYSDQHEGYFIKNAKSNQLSFQKMMEAFELFATINLSQDLAPFLFFDRRQPKGVNNLSPLINAIKNSRIIHFNYQKFYDGTGSERVLQPYALKEFKSRWYLMGIDEKDHQMKTFGLDRISELKLSQSTFTKHKHLDVEETFKDCFGVIGPFDESPDIVELSFTPFEGQYIKTLPLHHSQRVVEDNEKELRVELTLHPTHDFVMELLSYGDQVKVLRPRQLVNKVKEHHEKALNRYK